MIRSEAGKDKGWIRLTMNPGCRPGSSAGITLIETLVVISILTIIAFVLTPVIREGIDAWIFSISTADLVAEGRLAMRRMTKELKGANSITAITPTSLKFTLPDSLDEIEYVFSGNVLYRRRYISGGGSETNILARDINPFSFTYLKRNSDRGDPATAVADIWEICIDFTVTKDSRSLRFGSTVSPRNIEHPFP